MDLSIGDDRRALVESVRDYLTGTHGPEVLRHLDAGSGRDPAIWQGLAEMGLTGLCVPEAQSGLGLGLLDAVLIAVECGRACVAEPVVDTGFVAVPWLVAKGETARLAEIAAGSLKVALAHPINPWIADLDQAGAVIVDGRLAAPAELEAVRIESVDPLRHLFSAPATTQPDDLLLDLGALMSATQLSGLAEAMLDQATEYAKVRQQFGQPIGAFQAVKHHLASALVAIEFVRPLLWRAAGALEAGSPHASVAISHAKVAATDAALATAETAIQVHGAMGYTYEVDLHFWMKRSWALAGAWGDRTFHLSRIDTAVIDGNMPIGPENTFA
jgi:alkylation response protein AidB-like acyl-CoA dehydrogenase